MIPVPEINLGGILPALVLCIAGLVVLVACLFVPRGKLTYGADRATAVKLFDKAIKLNPAAAIAYMEFGNGLLMMEGDKKQAEAVKLYKKAAACKPADAMERLDVEQAKAELE